MYLIVQIITIAYLFLLVPFFFGILADGFFRKEKIKPAELLTNGYLLMMAVFWCISVVAVKRGETLTGLTWCWLGIIIFVTAAASCICRKRMAACFLEMRKFCQEEAGRKLFFGILLLSVIVSVCFTRPNATDMTLEIVRNAVAQDGMYTQDPYTGETLAKALPEHALSPVEMLYAVGACMSGMEAVGMLYYLIPVCLLFYFYLGIWRVGKQLFEKRENQRAFLLITIGIYWMTTCLEGQSVVTGIFLNSWNGLTWLSCFVIPSAFAHGLYRMKETEKCTGRRNRAESLFTWAVLVAAGQLTNGKGGFYIALMWVVTLFVILGRKGYENVITSGGFKKRI